MPDYNFLLMFFLYCTKNTYYTPYYDYKKNVIIKAQYNGGVEPMNGTNQYKFYNQCSGNLRYGKLK